MTTSPSQRYSAHSDVILTGVGSIKNRHHQVGTRPTVEKLSNL